ncbi:hypothetical protein BCR33DRAFT_851287 [Rhizoclosmatium globosum]|uniref:Uncharacterized protein n=1 Tax=Rhizoclosmatium globosum TaxID=329046 RepID=A0A1Y2C7Q6_9FUNG|nr:hypothetical protein BCR33DRAFT_851287 [Rhizoclosmatium globosum]|eukprot:ORY43063.1 hypothetical protein BCR33DRAFT_851287 [Rhizoclosmatium globosum]
MVHVEHHINNIGIVNPIQAGILDPHNVIVDQGVRNVVTCVNSDIQLQINNAAVAPVPVPPTAHPPSRQIIHDHVVQVSHGHMSQINGSKLFEKREEVFRDNDHRINFAYDFLAQNSPRVIGQPFPVAPVYFAYGDGSWNHQRPWAPVPNNRIREKAAHEHFVFVIDEHLTSQQSHRLSAGYEAGGGFQYSSTSCDNFPTRNASFRIFTGENTALIMTNNQYIDTKLGKEQTSDFQLVKLY